MIELAFLTYICYSTWHSVSRVCGPEVGRSLRRKHALLLCLLILLNYDACRTIASGILYPTEFLHQYGKAQGILSPPLPLLAITANGIIGTVCLFLALIMTSPARYWARRLLVRILPLRVIAFCPVLLASASTVSQREPTAPLLPALLVSGIGITIIILLYHIIGRFYRDPTTIAAIFADPPPCRSATCLHQ